MREIQLSQGQVALVDAEDFERINSVKWYASRQGTQKKFYAVRFDTVNGKRIKKWMHREVMNCPADMVVDHDNGNGLDCRKFIDGKMQLECVTWEENQRRAIEKRIANIAMRVFEEASAFFGEVAL